MNDNEWDLEHDQGALRIYPNTQNMYSVEKAVTMAGDNFVDISPMNGRLVIFDSRLVHSVQKVTSTHKLRRALTLWINRPNNSGVRGEVNFTQQDTSPS